MKAVFTPSHPEGVIEAPPSKSVAHRYLIAAALAEGESRITGISASEDISATIDCLRALGADIRVTGDVATVRGFDPHVTPKDVCLPCRESGSTLRFLLPLCWLTGDPAILSGSERLLDRPLSIYEQIARDEGLTLTRVAGGVRAAGRLRGGEYILRGDVSSQFITGLLLALPLTGVASRIRLLPPVESRSYLDLTISALSRFGGGARFMSEDTIDIPATGRLKACDCHVEGDYSNAAFFDALSSLGYPVKVTGLDPASQQGDRIYRTHFDALREGTPTISLADCPDLGPILMAMAAALHGARFTDTRRLRIKESDRGAAMAEELARLGVTVTVEDNEITVGTGVTAPREPLCGHNDHRIVMALSTLLIGLGGSICGAEAVKKSLPEYFSLLSSLKTEVTLQETE